MIGFKIADDFLSLPPDTSITITLQNPIFAENGIIPGSYSIPFNVPVNEQNIPLLGRQHVVESTARFPRSILAHLFLKGTPWMQGELKIRKVNGSKYNVNFQSGIRNLGADFRDKRIRELVDQTYTVNTNLYYKRIILQNKTGETGPYTITVNGESFTFDTLQEFQPAIDALEDVSCFYYPDGWTDDTHALYIQGQPAWDPLTPIGVKVDDESRYNVILDAVDDFFADYIAWLQQYNSDTPPDDVIRFPMMENRGAYKEGVTYGIINNQLSNTYVGNGVSDWISVNASSLSPCVMLRHVLDKIEEFGNVKLKGEFIDDYTLQTLIFWNGNSLDVPLETLGDNRPLIFWRRVFNVNEFVPDLTVGELIKGLQTFFNLEVRYDASNRTIWMNFRDNIVTNRAYVDLTDRSGPVLDFENEESEGLTLKSKADTADKYIRTGELDPDTPLVIGEGKLQIESILSSVPNGLHNASNEVFRPPQVEMEFREDFAARLMFYRGRQESATGKTYIAASQDTDTHSLAWTTDTGLYYTYWKNYVRFLLNRGHIERTINFHVKDLINLDWTRKIRIDRVNYLINTISLNVSMRGVKASKVTLYRVQ